MTPAAVFLSLLGAGLVAFRRPVAGQSLWLVSNAWLAYHNFHAGEVSQGVLFIAFWVFALWGVIYARK